MPSYHLVTFSSFQLTTKSILELVYSKVNLDILILFIYNWMLPAASNLIELVGHITDGASATNTSKSVAKINSAEGRVNIQNQRRPNIAPQYLASIWNETNIARYLENFWIGVWQHRNRPGIDLAWPLVFADTLRPFISMEIIFTPMQDRGRKCSVKLKFNFNAIQCNSSQRWNAKQWR